METSLEATVKYLLIAMFIFIAFGNFMNLMISPQAYLLCFKLRRAHGVILSLHQRSNSSNPDGHHYQKKHAHQLCYIIMLLRFSSTKLGNRIHNNL